jgi:hypothetical protein
MQYLITTISNNNIVIINFTTSKYKAYHRAKMYDDKGLYNTYKMHKILWWLMIIQQPIPIGGIL